MEIIILLGFIIIVGSAIYLIQRNSQDKSEQKNEQSAHKFVEIKDDTKNRPQRLTNNTRALDFYNHGMQNFQNKKYNKAVDWFDRAILEDSKCTTFYIDRGLLYLQLSKFDLALSDFNTAIELDPEDWLGHNNQAFTYNKIYQFDRAILSANQAISIAPDISNPYMARGIAYSRLGDYNKAKIDFLRMIEISPNDETGHGLYADILMKTGKYDEALAVLDSFIESADTTASSYNDRAWHKAYIGDYAGSLEDINNALSLTRQSNFIGTRGQTKWLTDDYEGALADFIEADQLSLETEYRDLPIHKLEEAVARYKLDNLNEAISLWKQIMTENSYYQSSETYQKLAHFAPPFYEAMQELEKLANDS